MRFATDADKSSSVTKLVIIDLVSLSCFEGDSTLPSLMSNCLWPGGDVSSTIIFVLMRPVSLDWLVFSRTRYTNKPAVSSFIMLGAICWIISSSNWYGSMRPPVLLSPSFLLTRSAATESAMLLTRLTASKMLLSTSLPVLLRYSLSIS